MTTAAKVHSEASSHFYLPNGTPFYEVPYADPTKGMRKANITDARKAGALPSVTTIMQSLAKPALEAWKIEQACLAVLTAPRADNEDLDAFVKRVLSTEKQQDAEAAAARDLGTLIHEAIELALQNQPYSPELGVYVQPALDAIHAHGRVVKSEFIVIGDGYGGRCDLELDPTRLVDFKTCKTLPKKESWPEHQLQLAAYAATIPMPAAIETSNLYISTSEPGKIAWFDNPFWRETFECGFRPLLKVWQWQHGLSAH